MVVMGNDQMIAQACAMGNLELNPFLPLVADALLGSLSLLTGACNIFRRYCVEGLAADEKRCRQHVESATAIVTALVEVIGYQTAQDVAAAAAAEGKSVREIVLQCKLMSPQRFDELISAEAVTRLGSPKPQADEEFPDIK